MATETSATLDEMSRRTIGRFILKLIVAFLAAYFLTSERGYLASVAAWLSFYALFSMVGGLLIKDAIQARSFNYWDEASWLLLVALLMQIASRSVA